MYVSQHIDANAFTKKLLKRVKIKIRLVKNSGYCKLQL